MGSSWPPVGRAGQTLSLHLILFQSRLLVHPSACGVWPCFAGTHINLFKSNFKMLQIYTFSLTSLLLDCAILPSSICHLCAILISRMIFIKSFSVIRYKNDPSISLKMDLQRLSRPLCMTNKFFSETFCLLLKINLLLNLPCEKSDSI